MACTGFLIGESRLHIEFHTEHRAPGGEMLEQHHAAFCFADHYATASLRAVRAADQFEAVNVITFGAASHVFNQLGVGSLLPFDFGKLPSDVVELHLFSKVQPPHSTKTVSSMQRRRPQLVTGAQPTCYCQVGAQSLQRFFRLVLVFLELLEGSHHVCSGYRLRLSRVLHPSLDELLDKLLSGVHSAVNEERQEVADHQTFAKGDPEHLVFGQT